jgi:hypothetical protein
MLGIVAPIVLVLGSCAWVVAWLTAPPEDRAEVEAHLDRAVLAYDRWGDTPVIVFTGFGDPRVYIDTLRLDTISIEWPPTPRWQWSGNWSSIPSSSDPASLGHGQGEWGSALFGQINDPAIARIHCTLDDVNISEVVTAPGYVVPLPDGVRPPDSCDFLDASGRVVWTANLIRSNG